MKTITISAFFSMILISTFGQNHSNEDYLNNLKSFLKTFFQPEDGNAVIAENIDSAWFIDLKETFSKDTFLQRMSYDHGVTSVIDSFIFTKQDRATLDSFFSDYSNCRWTDSILPEHSKMMSRRWLDTIGGYNDVEVRNYLSKCHARYLYFMSKPIFLRNGTICIIYSTNRSGYVDWPFSEGSSLIIYRKVKGKWIIYRDLE